MKYYILGENRFPTKAAIKEHYTNILNKYNLNDKLNQEDSKQVYLLLRNHPEFLEKKGVGIKFFRIETAVQIDVKYAKHRCFWIHRHDGTKIDFSIHNCYRYKNQIKKMAI
jgi:hypothetical protein